MSTKDHTPVQGFTLLEIMVVMVIMAIGAVMTAPTIGRIAEENSLRVVTAKVVSGLRKSHRQAMVDAETVTLPGSLSLLIPEKFRIETTANEIVFFPDGTALQALLIIHAGHGRHSKVSINPFSGLAQEIK